MGDMVLFDLVRDEDETGISGTGTVAHGVIFGDGSCVMRWLTEHTSTAFYASEADLVAIHGHAGRTRLVRRVPTPPEGRGDG